MRTPPFRVASGHQPEPIGQGVVLLVHGGAWAIPDDEVDAHREGVRQAVELGQWLLEAGEPAIEVVMEVVALMESISTFDAGVGARLDREGRAQLDAGLMDGATLAWGAVANTRRLAHPIRVARTLVDSDGQARLLVGDGAERYAADLGLPLVENEVLVIPAERARYEALRDEARFHTSREFSGQYEDPHGTVGCVARDREGVLAAATSTGGASYTLPGRVGDSPLIGSGYYANSEAAASATGWGEAIASVLLCGRAVDRVASGLSPQVVASERLVDMGETITNPRGQAATGGLILLDRKGRGAWAHSSPRMARGGWASGRDAWAEV